MADNKLLRVVIEGVNRLSPALARAQTELKAFEKNVQSTNERIRKQAATSQFAKGFFDASQESKNFDKFFKEAMYKARLAHQDRLNQIEEAARKERSLIDLNARKAKAVAQTVFVEREQHENESLKNALDRVNQERIARLRLVDETRRLRVSDLRSQGIQNVPGRSSQFISKDDSRRLIIDEYNLKANLTRDYFNTLRNGRETDHKLAIRNANNEHEVSLNNLRKRLNASRLTARLQAPTEASVTRDILRDRSNALRDIDNLFVRTGKRAGFFFSDVKRGFSTTGEFGRRMSKDVLQAESSFFRFGRRVGGVVNNINRLINLRWVLLVGFLQILGTLVTQLASALILLGSSAITAAVALGGALTSALGQAAVAFGVLYAALIRIQKVFSIVQLYQKQDLRNSRDAEAQADAEQAARDRLVDSIENLKDAHLRLSKARQQAARDLVDASLDERDANLSLKEAELGVLEAKERLRKEQEKQRGNKSDIDNARAQLKEAQARLDLAKKQGDQAQIGAAASQVGIAQSNLNSILDQQDSSPLDLAGARLGVQRAELTVDQARVRRTRQIQDSAEIRKKGVNKADDVVAAQQALTKATRELTRAKENLVKASDKETSAQANLKEQLADLSPAERRLYNATNKFIEKFKKQFRPVTDIIVDAFARAITRIGTLFDDPKVMKGATQVAQAIAGSIDSLSKFAISPEFKEALVFFSGRAAENIPKLTKAFENIVKALIQIGIAADPVLTNLIDGFLELTKKAEKFTRDEDKLKNVFSIAGEQLDGWLKLAGAIARVIYYLTLGAQGEGKGFLADITGSINELANFFRDNPEKVQKFFQNARRSLEAFGGTLKIVGKLLFETFTSKEAEAFTELILRTVVPAFSTFVIVAGKLSRLVVGIFNIPGGIGTLATFTAQLVLTYGIFRKLFPFLPRLRTLFGFTDDIVKQSRAIKDMAENFKRFMIMTKAGTPAMQALSATFPNVAKGIRLVGAALRFVFITNPWIAAVIGVIALIVLLDRKFHFIRPTIEKLGKVLKSVWQWVKDNWKLLLLIIVAPFAAAAYAIIKWRDKIIGFFKFIINWVRDNWKKLLLAILLAPFALTGAVVLAVMKFKGKIIGIFKDIASGIKNAFKEAFDWLRGQIGSLGSWVTRKLEKIPVIGRFFKKDKDSIIEDNPEGNKRAGLILKDKSLKSLAPKVAKLKESGLSNAEVIARLVKDNDISSKELIDLFAKVGAKKKNIGGTVDGSTGQPVPIIAHAGEWVLNKAQQTQLAKKLGVSSRQLQAQLFGTNVGKELPPGKDRNKYAFGTYNIVTQTDENDNQVFFLEMADGTFGQVTKKDVEKIERTKGSWIPNYVKRNSHGFKQMLNSPYNNIGERKFSMGGVVPQSFAKGGVVLNSVPRPRSGNTVNQNFNVKTEGETDWNYVLRLGAIHAMQGA